MHPSGHDAYAVFGYRFTVEAADEGLQAVLAEVLKPFVTGTASGLPHYVVHGEPAIGQVVTLDGSVLRRTSLADEAVDHVIWDVYRKAAPLATDRLLVHCGAVVSRAGTAVLLPAASGAGKTTTTMALVRAGFGYLSDEVGDLALDANVVRPHPRRLVLKAGTRRRFPELEPLLLTVSGADGPGYLDPERLRPGSTASVPAPVGAVVFVRYDPTADTTVTPVSKAEAVLALADNSFNGAALPDFGLHTLRRVMERATAWRVTFADVDEAVAEVEAICGAVRA